MALGFIRNLLDHAADLLGTIRDGIAGLAGRMTLPALKGGVLHPRIPIKEKFNADPRLKLISAGAILGVILVVTGIMLFLTRNSRVRRTEDAEAIAELFRMELPPEELFLDDEPDFLPDLLPERERRDEWNADDTRPYWTDPGDEGTGVYEDMMSAVVDGIMERLP
jgi:hypothetical protein